MSICDALDHALCVLEERYERTQRPPQISWSFPTTGGGFSLIITPFVPPVLTTIDIYSPRTRCHQKQLNPKNEKSHIANIAYMRYSSHIERVLFDGCVNRRETYITQLYNVLFTMCVCVCVCKHDKIGFFLWLYPSFMYVKRVDHFAIYIRCVWVCDVCDRLDDRATHQLMVVVEWSEIMHLLGLTHRTHT